MYNKKQLKLYFLLTFIFGLYFSQDYGIPWDEKWHRNKGKETVAYIAKTFKLDQILSIREDIPELDIKIGGYGSFFDVICTISEKVFSVNNKREAYLLRHKINFSIYFLGVYLIYLFSKELFKNRYIGFLTSMFYFLHPRLFAHGFYNGKDSIAQALVACALYPMLMVYKHKEVKWPIISGLIMGIAITTRIPITYLPFLFLLLILLKFYNSERYDLRKNIQTSLIFITVLIASIYSFWPILWASPILSLKTIFLNMSYHQWGGTNFYLGEHIKATELPWHYLPTWISITTPIMYIILFFTGLITFLINFKKNSIDEKLFQSFMLFGFLCPLAIIIGIGSVLYDAWRHLFFIYPFMVYFMSLGFLKIYELVKNKWRFRQSKLIFLLSFIVFCEPVYKILSLHPNQNVYFNSLAGKNPIVKFEGDYWALSMRQGLEWILENDKRDLIRIDSPLNIAKMNQSIIDRNQVQRLRFVTNPTTAYMDPLTYEDSQFGKPDYFLTNFREEWGKDVILKNKKYFPYINEIYSVQVDDMKILSIFKYK